MNEQVLLTEEQDGILILTLNRPEVMNALNFELLRALKEEMDTLRFKDDTLDSSSFFSSKIRCRTFDVLF